MNSDQIVTVSKNQIHRVINAQYKDPFRVLGIHPRKVGGQSCVAIRTFQPRTYGVEVIDLSQNGLVIPMNKLHKGGFYELVTFDHNTVFPYMLRLRDKNGATYDIHDPYRFKPVITELDQHLIGKGKNYLFYEKMGAHIIELEGIQGTLFAVWAPNARRVSVVGPFNNWNGRRHAMRMHGTSGIWELFIPGLDVGEIYKYEIITPWGSRKFKADPFGMRSELSPRTASVISNPDKYSWNDDEWMERRRESNPHTKPMSIYEVHLGGWRRDWEALKEAKEAGDEDEEGFLNYRELAHSLADYVEEMGFTHIELLPTMEHPFYGSWGYQVTGYFAPTCRYGEPWDFKYFVDYMHSRGIGVILDWVPAHFPKDHHSLGKFDGTALFEHADPRKGKHMDWGTLIFNYGRHEVRNFLISNAIYWLDRYHIDGLRVDAVASMLYLDYSRQPGQWVPNRYGGRENLEAIHFIKSLNEVVEKFAPGAMMIAEESTSWPSVSRPTYLGGLGFKFKWNMGWMHDMLKYMSNDPIYRKYHHNKITFSMVYAYSENFILPLSHDEVVHMKGSLINKMPGDLWQKAANLRLLYGYMWGHPGKKLLFMGSEFGQFKEFNHDESIEWYLLKWPSHRGIQRWVRDLNNLMTSEPAMYELDHKQQGFQWMDCNDTVNSVITFIRRGKNPEDMLLFICNFTPVTRRDYQVGVPLPGFWKEVLNSDADIYWGSNMGNDGGCWTNPWSHHGQPHSLKVTTPPLSVTVLKRFQ